jgi:hypothetical protein
VSLAAVAAQADGEPWLQAPGVTEIRHFNTVNMLMRKSSKEEALERADAETQRKGTERRCRCASEWARE